MLNRCARLCLVILTILITFGSHLLAAASAQAVSGVSLSLGFKLGLIGAFGAVTLVDANRAWQTVNILLAGADQGIVLAFRGLKSALSQKNLNKLLCIPFTEAQADAAGGTAIADAACKIYGAYTKKENTATDNWTWLYDSATDDTTAAKAMICLPQLLANQEGCFIAPQGHPHATGIVVTQYATDALGAVDGSTGAAGFVLVGAP